MPKLGQGVIEWYVVDTEKHLTKTVHCRTWRKAIHKFIYLGAVPRKPRFMGPRTGDRQGPCPPNDEFYKFMEENYPDASLH